MFPALASPPTKGSDGASGRTFPQHETDRPFLESAIHRSCRERRWGIGAGVVRPVSAVPVTRVVGGPNLNDPMNNDLETLFLEELCTTYDAENQLLRALPWMAQHAGFEELQEALQAHHRETERHVERLLRVFQWLQIPVRSHPCAAVQELIIGAEDAVLKHGESGTLDAALIAASHKVEHYEMAAYRCLCTWARMLGYDGEIVSLLEETRLEEKETDENLVEVVRSLAIAEAMVPAAVA